MCTYIQLEGRTHELLTTYSNVKSRASANITVHVVPNCSMLCLQSFLCTFSWKHIFLYSKIRSMVKSWRKMPKRNLDLKSPDKRETWGIDCQGHLILIRVPICLNHPSERPDEHYKESNFLLQIFPRGPFCWSFRLKIKLLTWIIAHVWTIISFIFLMSFKSDFLQILKCFDSV